MLNLRKAISIRLALAGMSVWQALAGLAVLLGCITTIWVLTNWNENWCDNSASGTIAAEEELLTAYRQMLAAEPLRTQHDLACPIYRNFIEVAERNLLKIGRCRRPPKHDVSFSDFEAYVGRIKAQVAAHCPSTP